MSYYKKNKSSKKKQPDISLEEKPKKTPIEFAASVNLNDNESEFVTFLI